MCKELKPASGCTVEGLVLPLWSDLAEKAFAGLNPLERLIYNNEPAGSREADLFRRELTEAIQYIRQNTKLTGAGGVRSGESSREGADVS